MNFLAKALTVRLLNVYEKRGVKFLMWPNWGRISDAEVLNLAN